MPYKPPKYPQQPLYARFEDVPEGLLTPEQLAGLPYPRVPGGRVRGQVRTPEYRVLPLYALAECPPMAHECADCGAFCESPCTWVDNRPLCETCDHIVRLRDAQRANMRLRAMYIEAARADLADETLAVLAVRLVGAVPVPGRGPEHTRPAAGHIEVIDREGRPLAGVFTQLIPSTHPDAPADALPAQQGADELRAALAGRRLVFWHGLDSAVRHVHTAGQALRVDFGLAEDGIWGQLKGRAGPHPAAVWRGDIDPSTGKPRPPTSPVTAEDLLALVRQMAETPLPDIEIQRHENHFLRREPRAVRVAVTGRPAAIRRIEAVLSATGMLAPDGFGSQLRPVQPSFDHPDFGTVHLPAVAFGSDEEP
ncbi:hypothetical protein [Streptodolium elevatio]